MKNLPSELFNAQLPSEHSDAEVTGLMKELKLSTANAVFQDQKDSSKFLQMSLNDQLYLLLSAEADKRRNNSYRRRLQRAQRESVATAIDLISRQGEYNLTRSQLDYLLSCNWCGQKTLVILGPGGSGKTDCCSAIIEAACRYGYKAVNLRYPLLSLRLSEAMNSRAEFLSCIKELCSYDLLVIDDFCICKKPRDNEAEAVKELLDACLAKQSGLIISSQLNGRGWLNYFGKNAIAEAIVERILRKSNHFLIRFESQSHRVGEPAPIPELKNDKGRADHA